MKTLAEIRAKLREQEEKKESNSSSGEIFPHWKMNLNESARVRFLPDANEDNTFFWVEKMMINLSFPGVVGQDEKKEVKVQVPCIEMYGDAKCPILSEIRPWFNTDMEELARKYWVKRSYLYSGFVIDSPLEEKEAPENPIRIFNLAGKIHKIVKSSLMDPDFENIPVDYINGTDFIIEKTQSGEYADYTTSKWARRETSLSEEQLEAIEKYGLKDLTSCLPKKPTDEALDIIFQMFNDSLEGNLYDPQKYANYYKPYGLNVDSSKVSSDSSSKINNQSKSSEESVKEESVKEESVKEEPVKEEEKTPQKSTTGAKSAEDILAALRAKRQS